MYCCATDNPYLCVVMVRRFDSVKVQCTLPAWVACLFDSRAPRFGCRSRADMVRHICTMFARIISLPDEDADGLRDEIERMFAQIEADSMRDIYDNVPHHHRRRLDP